MSVSAVSGYDTPVCGVGKERKKREHVLAVHQHSIKSGDGQLQNVLTKHLNTACRMCYRRFSPRSPHPRACIGFGTPPSASRRPRPTTLPPGCHATAHGSGVLGVILSIFIRQASGLYLALCSLHCTFPRGRTRCCCLKTPRSAYAPSHGTRTAPPQGNPLGEHIVGSSHAARNGKQ